MPAARVHSSQGDGVDLIGHPASGSMRFLLGAACIVIIAAGIKAASGSLALVLLGFLLAYSALPVLRWMMHRFHLRKSVAMALAGGLMGTMAVSLTVLLYENVVSVKEKYPIYQEHAFGLYQQVAQLLYAHGIDVAKLPAADMSASNGIVRLAQLILPGAGRMFSDGLVAVLLGGLLLSMIEGDTKRANPGSIMTQIQTDVARYVGIEAAIGALTALANLFVLVAFGVDFPVVWCILYFFLHFIPSIGWILALAPPICLALLMLGWKKALLVTCGILLNYLVAEYAIAPTFLKRSVNVSFMEMMLSLLCWGFLLGPVGGILAVPLTLAMKRIIPAFFMEKSSAAGVSG